MKKRAKIILSVCLVLLLTLGIGGYVYVSDCYRADEQAAAAMVQDGAVADVIMNSGEALVKAVSDKTGHAFGSVKIGFDASCVALAVALSFVLCDRILEVREGTLAAALLTGVFVNLFGRLFAGAKIAEKTGVA